MAASGPDRINLNLAQVSEAPLIPREARARYPATWDDKQIPAALAIRRQAESIDPISNVADALRRIKGGARTSPRGRPGKNRKRDAKLSRYPCNERLPAIEQTPCIRDGQLITLRFQPFSCAIPLCEGVQPLFAEV